MFVLSCLLVVLFALPTYALAIADPGSDPSGWASGLYTAITTTDWKHVAAFVLVGVTFAIRKWGPDKISWFKDTARGGAVLVVLLAVGTGVVNSLVATGTVSLKTLATAIQIALEASITWAGLFKALVENKPPTVATSEPVPPAKS